LSLLPVPGRAHQKKETLTKKSESHLDPQTAKSLCYSIPSGTSTCLTKQKLAEKETTLFSSDRQYPFQPIMKDKWVNCTAN